MKLYFPNDTNSNRVLTNTSRIKEKDILTIKKNNNGPKIDNRFGSFRFSSKMDSNTVKPNMVGGASSPTNREYHSDEANLLIKSVSADSVYVHEENGKIERFGPENVLNKVNFWCSSGDHSLDDEVHFNLEFETSYRVYGMWIHWAFAPGVFKIRFSNDKINWDDHFGGFRYSLKGGNVLWWKSILSNPATRWRYKSFDERITFTEAKWIRYIEITMKIPVNQYFGIYKVEFYSKTQAIVMIKSMKPRESLCLTVNNGILINYSPVFAVDCLQGISYGDNRDIWVLNSNGYITTYRDNKCLESPDSSTLNIIDCGIAADYKDDREKWILDYDGKIRSFKEQSTCLTIVDNIAGDMVPFEDLKASASSTQSDNLHAPENAIDLSVSNYWASNPSTNEVVFEVYLPKYPYIISSVTIEWKFPAKSFQVIGLLQDGYWKAFRRSTNNRETKTSINFMNYDILGIKIEMQDSTTKLNEMNVYGISNVNLHTGAKYLKRDACKNMLNDVNLWQIFDVSFLDNVTAFENKKAWSEIHKTRTKMQIFKIIYQKIPDSLMQMKEKALGLKKKIISLYLKIEDVQTKLVRFEDFIKSEKMHIFTIASSKYFPAIDCAHVIRAFPSKRSGFYWIMNHCTNEPLRVYCDFDSYDKKAGLDYYIFNNNQKINTPLKGIMNYQDIRMFCAKEGLEPIHIKNMKMLKNIYFLLLKMNFNLKDQLIFPLAYDYNCDFAKCSGKYKSLNDDNSHDINDLLSGFKGDSELQTLVSKNIFDDNGDGIKNIAAFGINDMVVYIKLIEYQVGAIICSTNDDGSKKVNSSFEIDCDTNLKSELFSNYEINTNLRLVCPAGCASDPSPIYGTGIYTDNSSICKAALHAGFIKDTLGGTLEVNVEPGRKNYNGSTKYNIDSLDYSEEWSRSFRVKKFNPYCPLDKIKEYMKANGKSSSFVSLGENVTFRNKGLSEVNNGVVISRKNVQSKSNLSFAKEELDKLIRSYRFTSENSYISSKRANVNKLDIVSSPHAEMTTQEAIVSIQTTNEKDNKQLESFNNIGQEFKTLIGKVLYQVNILNIDKELGLKNQNTVFMTLNKRVVNIRKKIFEIGRKTQQIVSKTDHLLHKAQSRIDNFLLMDQFLEDYSSQSILNNYQIFNNKKGIGKPPKWEYYMYNLDGHVKTIIQKDPFIDSRTGSHLIIKNRDFYDFELRFSVLIRDNNTFGVAFRYKDPYNYYIFEISKQDKGFKRVRKFVKGLAETIDFKYDGGYNADVWYNIKIRAQQSTVSIYMTDEQVNFEKKFVKVFEFFDNGLVHGTIAFSSFGIKFLLLDSISVIPIPCTDFNQNGSQVQQVVTPTCPRFYEDFKNNFEKRWSVVDPLNSNDGPSAWTTVHNQDEREFFLSQNSLISGISEIEEGTIYLLKDKFMSRVCSEGKFTVKFKALNEGMIGIVFRYNDKGSFYIVEISGEKEKYIRLRKKIDGVMQLISSKPLIGYSIGNWYSVVLFMKNDNFNVYMTQNYLHDSLSKIFDTDVNDTDLKVGFVGISTYKTRAFFSEISLSPFDDLDKKDELLFIDEEALDLPKRSVNHSALSQINKNIKKFTWEKCLTYKGKEERKKFCDILFHSEIQLNRCKLNFCESCCSLSVDLTNPQYRFLCIKQCNMLEKGSDNSKSWKACVQPKNPEDSIYPYCETLFEKDFYQKIRCKTDMCNLCCVSFDEMGSEMLSNSVINECYLQCVKCNDYVK